MAEANEGDGWVRTVAELPTVVAEAGLSGRASEETPEAGVAPCQADVATKEGELQVPTAEVTEETPATIGPIVVVLDPEDGALAATEPTEARQAGGEDGPLVPPEPEVEGAPPAAKEGEIVPAAVEGEAEPIAADEARAKMPIARLVGLGAASTGEAGTTASPPKKKHRPARRDEDESPERPPHQHRGPPPRRTLRRPSSS